MVRAAFLMDRLMAQRRPVGARVHSLAVELRLRGPGHHGDADDRRHKDRLTTILIAPLMTCSARLPGLHADHRRLHSRNARSGRRIGLQGLVLFVLYIGGIVGAFLVALVLRRDGDQGQRPRLHDGDAQISDGPRWRDVLIGAVAARRDFPQARRHDHPRAPPIVLWALLSFPQAARDGSRAQVDYDRRPASPAGSRSSSARSASTATSRSR